MINQEFNVACLQEGDEVYVPFSFLRDYFEVHGTLSTVGKHPPRFDWMHTNAKINYPKGIYDSKGIFMYFENYNVEVNIIRRFLHYIILNDFFEKNKILGQRPSQVYKCI